MEIADDDEDYLIFLDFVKEFFVSDSLDNKYNCLIKDNKNEITSVKNSRMKNSSNSTQNNLKKLLKNKNIKKAIPGGMYGCALLLREVKSKELKDKSLGKL